MILVVNRVGSFLNLFFIFVTLSSKQKLHLSRNRLGHLIELTLIEVERKRLEVISRKTEKNALIQVIAQPVEFIYFLKFISFHN